MGSPNAEVHWTVGIVDRMESWTIVEVVPVSVGVRELASAAAAAVEFVGFLGCTLRNTGGGRAEGGCSEHVD